MKDSNIVLTFIAILYIIYVYRNNLWGWELIASTGGSFMKKLISSTISVVTSAALLTLCTINSAFAEYDNNFIDWDPAEEELYLGDIDPDTTLPKSPELLSNYKNGSYNYGDNLDSNNRAIYNAFIKLTTPTEKTITVSLPETIIVKLSARPGSDKFTEEDQENYQNALFGNCKPGIDAALFDCPEIYWIEPSQMSVGLGPDTTSSTNFFTGVFTLKIRSITITPAILDGFESLDDAIAYGKLLDDALEKVPVDGNNRYEQLKSIHDYIAKFTYYDTEAKFSSSALGALVEPGVVCEGYSEAFKLICDRLDIPCVCVFGNMNLQERSGHMWNYVRMEDGIWYAMDVTWDDTDGKGGRELKYDYFLKGSTSFFTNHTPETDYAITQFVYPPLSEKNYVLTAPQITTTTTTTTTSQTTTTTSTTSTTSISATSTTSIPPVVVVGDLNHDGQANVADLVYCQASLLGKIKPAYSCDCNGDGVADVFDLVFMRKLLLK